MLNNLKVGPRLIIGSTVLCLLAALLAGIGYRQIHQLRAQLDSVPEMVATRVMLSDWQGSTAINAARAAAILRSDDAALGEHLAADIKATSQNISVLQKRLDTLV